MNSLHIRHVYICLYQNKVYPLHNIYYCRVDPGMLFVLAPQKVKILRRESVKENIGRYLFIINLIKFKLSRFAPLDAVNICCTVHSSVGCALGYPLYDCERYVRRR
jgi:hypothetical protein